MCNAGYAVADLECAGCGKRFVLVWAVCNHHTPHCIRCGGYVELVTK